MRRNLSFNNLVILCLAGFLTTTPQIFAENESKIEDVAENENVKFLETTNSNNNSENNSENISYKKKIIKSIKETITPYREQIREENRNKIKARANNSSLKVIIKEIVGEEEENRSAVIEFEGKEITVVKNQVVEGKFKVIDIYPDRMVVYSSQEQRRHTYKLNDNNLVNDKEADTSKDKLVPRLKTTTPIKKPERSEPIPPLIVNVKEIVGEGENRSAVIEFEGKEITVVKGQVVDCKFKVIEIYPDRIFVYSPKEQRRHTYKIKN